jgi:hypothetical protein
MGFLDDESKYLSSVYFWSEDGGLPLEIWQ